MSLLVLARYRGCGAVVAQGIERRVTGLLRATKSAASRRSQVRFLSAALQMTRALTIAEVHTLPAVIHLAASRPSRPGRPVAFDHHGIYLGDDSVFELKKGGGRAVMQLATVEGFAMGNPVCVVEHGGRESSPFRYFDADPPEIIRDRVRRLLAIGDVGRYDLWGLNCEHVATWCMSGIADSIQVRRRWFQPSAYAGIAVMLGFSLAVRLEKPLPGKLLLAVGAFSAMRMIPVVLAHYGAWQFTSLVEREQPPPSWYWGKPAT
jgi:hypothetical protein